MSRRRRKVLPDQPVEVRIERLSEDGRGVARIQDRTVFVHGGLPGETVLFQYRRAHRRYDEGAVVEVLEASPDRVAPRCPHFGVCGGCSLQHLSPDAQRTFKQNALVEQLADQAGLQSVEMVSPITGSLWGYRRKARLGVKDVPKKGGVLVGFREKGSRFITPLERCEVLHPAVGERIMELREMIGRLSVRQQVPQIEVAIDDADTVLVLRHLSELTASDREELSGFARAHDVRIYLQPGGLDTVQPLSEEMGGDLSYRLPEFDVDIHFEATDFTQVNAEINRAMVHRAVTWLEPLENERVLDLFCGLGNFSLPLGQRAGYVRGVEGDPAMVARAAGNAARNGIDSVEFRVADLAAEAVEDGWAGETFDKILLDPPRSGALQVVRGLRGTQARRIVYVSCNPQTLARDAGELAKAGYGLVKAGIMDMFPHTSHVESIALFEHV